MRSLYIIGLVGAVIIVGLLVSVAAFDSTVHTRKVNTYVEPQTAVRATLHSNASNGQVALTLNTVSDATDPGVSDLWTTLNLEAEGAGIYKHPLAPPSGERYLIANLTVTNVQREPVAFHYTDLFLVTQNGSAYYANYAVCDANCSAQALKERTLPAGASYVTYVLFSVPVAAHCDRLVYSSTPQIVVVLS